ncbi:MULTISPECIES: hypothetical protein [Delftia]|uniref:Uncharacterized protein n=1 Tax=Delftia lacustris TaxID=558537 RepID=A0A7T2YS42_9BURK|nr:MULTISPECIES: hypothetical protein [Delftia]QPS80922.1 hypothetical protein I6G47_28775 [Delftia lacustris]
MTNHEALTTRVEEKAAYLRGLLGKHHIFAIDYSQFVELRKQTTCLSEQASVQLSHMPRAYTLALQCILQAANWGTDMPALTRNGGQQVVSYLVAAAIEIVNE